jgi:hypothetical protein
VLLAAAVVVADHPEAYTRTQEDMEVDTTSNVAAQADTPGAFLWEDRAIYNNRNPSPTTSRRLLGSKPTDNKRKTMFLRLRPSA